MIKHRCINPRTTRERRRAECTAHLCRSIVRYLGRPPDPTPGLQKPHYGTGRRRGAGAVLRSRCHAQEELPVRVRVADHARKSLLAAHLARQVRRVARQVTQLDFRSVPYIGERLVVQPTICPPQSAPAQHLRLSRPRRRQSGVLLLDADIHKGEEAEQIFRFIEFWTHSTAARHSTSSSIPS